jgi:hypothetical protein
LKYFCKSNNYSKINALLNNGRRNQTLQAHPIILAIWETEIKVCGQPRQKGLKIPSQPIAGSDHLRLGGLRSRPAWTLSQK